jgi:two-component system nitrate/nitrite response regulator NarL
MAGAPGPHSLLRPETPVREEPPIRLAIVSAIRLYREGLAASLASTAAFEIVATAVDIEGSLTAIVDARADVVLLDASGERPVELVQKLAAAAPSVRVVALAVVEAEGDVIPLAEAGVAGYLTVDQSLAELAETIIGVAHGENPCSPTLAAMLLRRVTALAADRARSSDKSSALTNREREILVLLERGLSNKEVAHELQIGVPTVKNHVHNILEKLEVRTRGAAAARARI